MQFVIGACMGLLIWWLDEEASCSAEEMHAIFQELTKGVVRPRPPCGRAPLECSTSRSRGRHALRPRGMRPARYH